MLRPLLAVALALAPTGCVVGGHAAGGGSVAPPRRCAYGGGIGSALILPGRPPHNVHLGVAAEGMAEIERGSTMLLGGEVGYQYLPSPSSWPFGFEGHADVGVPVTGTDDGYVGATIGMPIMLLEPHPVTARNRRYWFVARRVSLVLPQIRTRALWRHDADTTRWRPTLTGGFALRMRLASDLF